MKGARIPAIVFVFILIGYVVFLSFTVPMLPARVASHFDAAGQANGWMNRTSAAVLQGIVGLVLPLIVAAAFCSLRFVPTQGINMPHREYWLALERRSETLAYLARQGLWLASLLVCVEAMVWYQLIESNSKRVPQLSTLQFMATLGIFGAAMIIWVIRLFRHFAKRD